MPRPSYAAIILAGGRSERLGGADKAMVELDGLTLLDRVLSAVEDAEQSVVVGPERQVSRPVTWVQEEPIDGGPAAAFAAGVAATSADTLLLIGVDLPFIGGAVTPLLEALSPQADVAVLHDDAGRANFLASAWHRHAATTRLSDVADVAGLPMRLLLDGLTLAQVRDTGGWSFDCDTWDAVEQARARGAASTR